MDKLLALTNPIQILTFLESDRGQKLIRWLTYSMVVILSVGVLLLFLKPYYMLGINQTDSLPGLVYLVQKQEKPARGDLVVFRIPEGAKRYPRGYTFTKIAVGVAGDKVEFRGREVFVNGVSRGLAKPHSRHGEPLDLGPAGLIPAGHYFAWTPHKDSYDSRYADIGWVTPDRLEGRAIALF